MRLSIILAICFIGVCVSASGLRTRRGFFDDLKNKTKNAFEGFKNLLGNHEKNATVEIKVAPVEEKAGEDRVKRFLDPFEVLKFLAEPEKFTEDFLRILKNRFSQPRDKRDTSALDNVDKNKAVEVIFDLLSKIKSEKYEYNPVAGKVMDFINNAEDPDYVIRDFFIMLEEMKDQNNGDNTAAKILDFIRNYEDQDALYGDFFKMLYAMRDAKPRSKREVSSLALVDNNKLVEVVYDLLSKMKSEKYEYNPYADIILSHISIDDMGEPINHFFTMLEEMRDENNGNNKAAKILEFIQNYEHADAIYTDFFNMLYAMKDAEPQTVSSVSALDFVDNNKLFEVIFDLLSNIKNEKYEYNPVAGQILGYINAYGKGAAIKNFFIMLEDAKDNGNKTAAKILDFIRNYEDQDALYGDFIKMLYKMKDPEWAWWATSVDQPDLNSINDTNKL